MKKVTNLFIRILFIIFLLFFLLGKKNVFGYEQTYKGNNFIIPDEIITLAEQTEEYSQVGTDYSLFIARAPDINYYFITFNPIDITFYYDGAVTLYANQNFNRISYIYNLDFSFYGRREFYGNNNKFLKIDNNCYFISTHAVYNNNNFSQGDYFYEPVDSFKSPSFSNSIESFKTNSFKNFIISPGDLSPTDQLEFTIRNDDSYYELPDSIIDGYEEINTFILDNTSPYFKTIDNSSNFYYEIPKTDLTFSINDNNKYTLLLFWDKPELLYTEISFTVGILSDEELLLTDVSNTNKNIFSTIGDIFNLLNPFHDNFFGRKLVELIIDGLKSLFIPENEYFSNYFDELNNWFSDRLGFLYYPLDVLFDLLNRFLSLSSENLAITIPEIKEPTTDIVLINNQTFDFNTLLENETLRHLHNIYLIIVDAVICFGVVNLLYQKYEEVIAK